MNCQGFQSVHIHTPNAELGTKRGHCCRTFLQGRGSERDPIAPFLVLNELIHRPQSPRPTSEMPGPSWIAPDCVGRSELSHVLSLRQGRSRESEAEWVRQNKLFFSLCLIKLH